MNSIGRRFLTNRALLGNNEAMITLERELFDARKKIVETLYGLIDSLFTLDHYELIEMSLRCHNHQGVTGYPSFEKERFIDHVNELNELINNYITDLQILDRDFGIMLETTDFYELIQKYKGEYDFAKIHLESLIDFESSQEINDFLTWLISAVDRLSELIGSYLNLFSSFVDKYGGGHTKSQIIGNQKNYSSENKLSYHWQGSPDELSRLYQKMKDNNLIANDTSGADFKAIFEGKPLGTVKPIKWLNKPVLLAYFVNKLIGSKKVLSRDESIKWVITKECFNLTSDFKQSAENYKNNKSGLPKNHHLIDELF